ncbi:MAG: AFG1 family ATPase [Burkholderiales bacterium]|nr:AFG1 family ATPase [Burkholderiales bacterium]
MSPLRWYEELSKKPGFVADPAQRDAVQLLESLYLELLHFKTYRQKPFMKVLGRRPPPKGIYLYGGVGRGKSLMMDAFFANVPLRRKRRVHFHPFMQEVHGELGHLKHEEDPLLKVAAGIAKKVRLLCFDEFHVNDIADAMILGRLLEELFRRGVVMVITSNYAADDLYKDGLQRERFLPTIELIKVNMVLVPIAGDTDYRLRAFEKFSVYHTPLSADAEAKLADAFALVAGIPRDESSVTVNERQIPVKKIATGAIWFDFEDICGGPRSQIDYLQIAHEYHTVAISNIPKLAPGQASEARRLALLVDVFYDNKVKLMVSAAVPPAMLYPEGLRSDEFQRTVSRLLEMQTREYLGLGRISS